MNQKEVDEASPGSTIWDRGHKVSVTGLHLRAFEKKKVFYLFYRTRAGIQRKPKLGPYPTLSIDQARKIAKEMLADVASGGDPSLHKMQLRGELTVDELFKLTWKKHWNNEKFIKSGHAREVQHNYLSHVKPAFGPKKLSEVKAAIVGEWHSLFNDRVYVGNRSLEVLSTMYSFAEKLELRTQHTNPCRLVDAYPENKRERYAEDHELLSIGVILEREKTSHPKEVAFISLLLFTGARPSAIERATWIDLHSNVLFVDGKCGPEKIHLPPQATAIISSLPRDKETIVGIKFPRLFWNQVRKEAGCEDLWARDLRRTFATTAMSEDFEMSSISELLNHKSAQTTKVYAKLKDQSRVTVVSETASKLESLLKGTG